ncbi:hypothetical protein HDU96_010325 [Phlyctochytrium bullatum]|nr:hypothetical protein HDU96_010325 [Phlyctochytrium bullatum]
MVEIFTGQTAFPGTSASHQQTLILEAFGVPRQPQKSIPPLSMINGSNTRRWTWDEFVSSIRTRRITRLKGVEMDEIAPEAREVILGKLLVADPLQRASAVQALQTEYFEGLYDPIEDGC